MIYRVKAKQEEPDDPIKSDASDDWRWRETLDAINAVAHSAANSTMECAEFWLAVVIVLAVVWGVN